MMEEEILYEEELYGEDSSFAEYLHSGEDTSQKRRSIDSKSTEQHQSRVIAHIDLDCFYVQVERYHNTNLKDKPVAVVQCK